MNPMQRPFAGLSFLAAIALLMFAAPAISQDAPAAPEPLTFESRCGQCHRLDQAERLVPAEWVVRVGVR